MTIGPVQLLVLGFDSPKFKGEILAEFDRLRDSDTVRMIDGLAVRKDKNGDVSVLQRSDLTEEQKAELGVAVGALLGLGAGGVGWGGGNIMGGVEHRRDGPEGETVTSTLEQGEVGTDEDGEPITSCVVMEAETATADTSMRGPKLTPNQSTMLTILLEAMPQGLTVAEWREAAGKTGINVPKQRLYDLRGPIKTKKPVHDYPYRWYVTNARERV